MRDGDAESVRSYALQVFKLSELPTLDRKKGLIIVT